MGKDDHVITAYRDHGHAIAVGMDTKALMAELYGKATGCSKGKGGSMHYFAPDKNYWGGHGIVGGQIPLGTGLAYALKYQGTKAEIEEYRNTKDPIQLFQKTLLTEGVLTEATAAKIDEEAKAESDNAAEFAEASPYPTAADIQTDVYWEADNPSERKSQGRLF